MSSNNCTQFVLIVLGGTEMRAPFLKHCQENDVVRFSKIAFEGRKQFQIIVLTLFVLMALLLNIRICETAIKKTNACLFLPSKVER